MVATPKLIAVRPVADAAANRILRREYAVCLGDRVKSNIPWEMKAGEENDQKVNKGDEGTVIGLEWDGKSNYHCLVVLFDNGPHHYNFTGAESVIGLKPRCRMDYLVGQPIMIPDANGSDYDTLAIVQAVGEDGVDAVSVRCMKDGRGMIAHEYIPFEHTRHAKHFI